MSTANTAFYKSKIKIGSTIYPARPNMSITVPKNWNIGPILGNFAAVNYGDGLRNPVIDVTLVCLDAATSALSTAFLNYAITRTNDAAHDISEIANGVTFWNGRTGWILNHAKLDTFMISTSKTGNEDIVLRARFVGADISAAGDPGAPLWSTSKVLRFNACSFASPLTGLPWSMNLVYSNNSTPNLALDGTTFPIEHNAGMASAGMAITLQEADGNPVTDENPVTVTIAGGTASVAFAFPRVLNMDPDTKAVQVPRVMRHYPYVGLAATPTGMPMTIS